MRDQLSDRGAALFDAFLPYLTSPGRGMKLLQLAAVMYDRGQRGDATVLCLEAIADAPDDPQVAVFARALIGEGLPGYHLPLLNDVVRLEGFEKALRATTPGKLVLDVGTGSGLLGMMAARAGAQQVVACEKDPALAVLAAENVKRNGLADVVRVLAKDFRDLQIGVDLPRRADVFVSDIEARHETARYAREQLLTPDAVTVPEALETHVALADLDSDDFERVESVCGFDMRAFNLALGPSHRVRRHIPIDMFSTSALLFEDDLSGQNTTSGSRSARVIVQVQRDAQVRGVLQWSSLRLAAGVTISSQAGSQLISLRRHFFPIPTPLTVSGGQTVAICGRQSRSRTLIWVDTDHSIT